MKYVVILGDGMADYRQEILNNKTPLEVAKKPNIDRIAKMSEVGLVRTVPEGMKPGSDVANLSVMGYDPKECYTGRSPLEAASIGIELLDTDVTARANLVTLSDEPVYADKTMIDYSAGEISTAEAKVLIDYLAKELSNEVYSLYAGISYRHCLVIDKGRVAGDLTPPHDITGKPIKDYLPRSELGKNYLALMERSHELLKDHPVNIERIKNGKRPANSLWFWGEGTKPALQKFKDKFFLNGGIISAVDLLKGIGKLADMQVIEVEGATGNYDTNFSGKAKACIDALKGGLDYVYLHMEAPDECGHHGDLKNKIYSIERIDEDVVKPIFEYLDHSGEPFAMLICPDHPTPIATMTHCADPVPYVLYKSDIKVTGVDSYSERNAESTGVFVQSGVELSKRFFNK
ncbi:MAG: cofactor-independent phosphoglycerate mutase [Clostridiales bacterium]|nr:cofactor-independent phosphoglycerate mutase [Clostridiales bacterium]